MYLFQLIEYVFGIRQVPVSEKFVNDSQVLPRLGKPRKQQLYVTLSLLLEDAP
jgi:hypothetical protein